MALFKKRETYNEQMLREAGLDRVVFKDPAPPPDQSTRPPTSDWSTLTRDGRLGPPDWDATTTTTAPGILGDQVRFTVLPNGELIVEEEQGDGDLSPLADAIEGRLDPPYKAIASRQEGDLWGVGAKRIEVTTIPLPDADTLELSQSAGETELRVDGESSDAAAPVELQRLGERTGGDFSVQATRIDGDEWEVRVSPL